MAQRHQPLRPVSSPLEEGAACLAAPVPSGQVRATPKRSRNRLQWLQIQLFLEDLPKRPVASA